MDGEDPRFQREIFFARLLRGRLLDPQERQERGVRSPRAYELPDGRILTPRQLRKLAGTHLSVQRFPDQGPSGRLGMVARFRAWKEGKTPIEVWEDPEFQRRWQYVLRARRSRSRDRQVRIARAWELMDVVEPSIDGGWDYTDEFLAWLAAGAPR